MKKITLFAILALAFSWQGFSQFGCGSGVVITDGYTASGITTPGTAGAEDWNTNPTGTSINASYWDDDVYLFEYTAGATTEEISMTIFSRNSWNGIGIFSDCTGDTFSGELDTDGNSGSDVTKTVTALVGASTTVYIAVGQWGTPNDLDFDVTEFSVNAISCGDPLNIQGSSFTTTTADFSWGVEPGASDGYNWMVMADGEDPEMDTPIADGSVASGTEMIQVTGLAPGTSYDFYVQSNCGTANGVSGWSGPVSFETECSIYMPDYIEGFDTYLPNCWTEASAGDPSTGPSELDDSSWMADEYLNTGSNMAVNINLYTNSREEWLISPSFDLSGGGYELVYNVALTDYQNSNVPESDGMGSDDEVQVLISQDNGTTWENLITYDQSSYPSHTGEIEIIDLSAYAGTVKFAFWATDGDVNDPEDYDFFIDEFKVRTPLTCAEVTDIVLSNITTTAVDVSWTVGDSENAWDIKYGTPGFDPLTEGTLVEDTDGTLGEIVTGLDSNTEYEVYVRAVCGANDESPYNDSVIFSTLCNPFGDFLEAFDTTDTGEVPNCWNMIDDSTSDFANVEVVSFSGPFSAPNHIEMYNSDDAGFTGYLITPALTDLANGTHQLSFHAKNNGGILEIGTMTDVTDATTYTAVEQIATTTDYEEYTVNFDTPSTDSYIVFKGTFTATYDYLYIDNVVWQAIPTCPKAIDVMVDGLSYTSADISWTAGGGETEWNVIYGEANFDPFTEGETLNVTGTPEATLPDLTPEAAYDVYVRAVCAPGDESGLSTLVSFSTDYCESVPSSNDGAGFTNFDLAGTITASPDDTTYDDFTATPVDVSAGTEVPFTVTLDTGFGYDYDYNLWVDLNNNLIFEASELLVTGLTGGASVETIDASFTIPEGAAPGDYRMRFSAADNGQNPPNPCYSGGYGNTAEFTLNVETTVPTTEDCGQEQFSNAFENGSFIEEGGQLLANDFIVSANTMNFSADNVTANILTQGGIATMDVIFFEDNDGLPGAEIQTFEDVVPTSQDIIGEAFGFDVHEVVLDLPTAVDFAGDGVTAVTYWVQLVGVPTAAGTQVGWETTTVDPIGSFLAFDDPAVPGVEWIESNADGVFSITGQCEYISGCLQPEALTASNITVDSLDLMWTEIGDATEWTIEYGAPGFTLGDGTEVIDNDGTPGITITDLDGLTSYDFYVTSNCTSEDSLTAGPLTATTIDTYCTPIVDFAVEPITLVDMENISNVSDAVVDNSPAVENFTNLMIEVDQAGSYAISLEGNTGGPFTNFFTVFVDWNQNGILDDASEVYEIGSIDSSTGIDGQQATGTIQVPADALLGETRLRVFKNYDSSVIDPCAPINFGQVEDYTVNVSPGVADPCAAPSDIVVDEITETTANVSWTENGTAVEWEIEYGETDFTQGSGTILEDNDGTLGETLVGLTAETTYDVYVRAICADGTESDWTAVETFTTEDLSVTSANFQNFSYYPNPVKSNLNLKAGLEIEKVSIYNLLGQEVISLNPTSLNAEIDLSRLQAGPYMVMVSINGEIKTFKVIKN